MPARSPALKAMTAAEKGELLDALLTDQPALQTRVEALAAPMHWARAIKVAQVEHQPDRRLRCRICRPGHRIQIRGDTAGTMDVALARKGFL